MKTRDITIRQFEIAHKNYNALTTIGNDSVYFSPADADSFCVSKKDIPDLIAILNEVMRIEESK